MFVSHREALVKKELKGETLRKVTKQVLVGEEQGWDDYVMRMFTLGEEGFTPRHTHDWPHIAYVVEGTGSLFIDGTETAVKAGSVAFVPNNSNHQFRNTGCDNFVFICIVPKEGDA